MDGKTIDLSVDLNPPISSGDDFEERKRGTEFVFYIDKENHKCYHNKNSCTVATTLLRVTTAPGDMGHIVLQNRGNNSVTYVALDLQNRETENEFADALVDVLHLCGEMAKINPDICVMQLDLPDKWYHYMEENLRFEAEDRRWHS